MATQPHPASANLIPFNLKIPWDYILGTTINTVYRKKWFLFGPVMGTPFNLITALVPKTTAGVMSG